MASNNPPAPAFSFTFQPSLAPFNVPMKDYIASHPEYDIIASGALVFDSHNRLLLLQRASHDSMPNRWEVPGGAVDLEDETILHGVAREVWEESGLKVTAIGPQVGTAEGKTEGYVFTRRGLKFCRFTFEAEVENTEAVRVDPNEHQKLVWATEEECRSHRVVGNAEGEVVEIEFTTEAQEGTVLEGFRLRKQAKSEGP